MPGRFMTAASLDRLRASYDCVAPHVFHLTGRFYDRLFALRPDLLPLFQGDVERHRGPLAAALALIARNLPVLGALERPLEELGAIHARAGVRPEHYAVAGEAMLAALAGELGERWTPELAADWENLLATVAGYMIAGSVGHRVGGGSAG